MIQIFTDTSANLPASYIQKYALRVIPLTYLIDGVEAHQDPTVDFDEIVEKISQRRHEMCQYFTVDDLAYLERGGRVSKAAAIVGTVLKIKPLLRGDEEGKIVLCGKTRGRKQSLTSLADFYEKLVTNKTEEIGIAHADDAQSAQFLLDELRKRGFTGDCLTVCYEPVTGCHVGPGTVALFFYGVHR